MSLIVQKFGGTSVASVGHIEAVADKICRFRDQGHDIVAVLSAMAGETNRLAALAHEIMDQPTPRELDALLATGEQVSIALLAMALERRGRGARSFTGGQIRILTDDSHTRARIREVDSTRILAQLEQGNVVVAAGFQGVTESGCVSTLGRGGSDTTAVALAAALEADQCQTYTDVRGVYTTHPPMTDGPRLLRPITFEAMTELSTLRAQRRQTRSVQFSLS